MNHAIRRLLRNVPVALSLATTLSAVPALAYADGSGCQVLGCLNNPGSQKQYGACVPPIEKRWTALRHCDPFPTCDFSAGLASFSPGVRNAIPAARIANLGVETGVINVMIDSAVHARVWWGAGGIEGSSAVTEYYGTPDLSGVLNAGAGRRVQPELMGELP